MSPQPRRSPLRKAADPPKQVRENLLARFPWINERKHPMVIGCDLDALLSAAFMHHFRDWTIIGFYDLTTVYAQADRSFTDLRSAIWIDLDIAQADIRSVGHHVLTHRRGETVPALASSLNPNLHRGISAAQFNRKYPLATVHWLAWLLDERIPLNSANRRCLLWLPDSAWIVVQKYRQNVDDWLQNVMPHPDLLQSYRACDTEPFEAEMSDLFERLGALDGFRQQTRGQIRSRHRGLQGFQFRVSNPAGQREALQAGIEALCTLMGWNAPTVPRVSPIARGTLNPHSENLSAFLERERVFSYAIRNAGVVSYTIMPEHYRPGDSL